MLLQLTPHGTNEMFPDYDNNAKALLVPGGCLLVFDYGATTVEMVKKLRGCVLIVSMRLVVHRSDILGGQDITVRRVRGGVRCCVCGKVLCLCLTYL